MRQELEALASAEAILAADKAAEEAAAEAARIEAERVAALEAQKAADAFDRLCAKRAQQALDKAELLKNSPERDTLWQKVMARQGDKSRRTKVQTVRCMVPGAALCCFTDTTASLALLPQAHCCLNHCD